MKTLNSIFYSLMITIGALASANTAAEQKMVILGDSLSAAYGIDEDQGWVQLLRNRLSNSNIKTKVINASISGETTGGGLNRLAKILREYQPKLLVIELGGNDGLRGYPIKHMKNNLQKMIKMAKDQHTEVILLGMKIPPNYGQRYSELFYNSYFSTAEKMEVALVPFFLEGVATNPELMQADGIHPTARGQQRMLNNVWEALIKALKAT